jgi:hypothetical protein
MKIMAVPSELHHSSNHNGLAESGDANLFQRVQGLPVAHIPTNFVLRVDPRTSASALKTAHPFVPTHVSVGLADEQIKQRYSLTFCISV